MVDFPEEGRPVIQITKPSSAAMRSLRLLDPRCHAEASESYGEANHVATKRCSAETILSATHVVNLPRIRRPLEPTGRDEEVSWHP